MSKPLVAAPPKTLQSGAASVPGFVLLFSSSLLPGFSGFQNSFDGFAPIPDASASALRSWRDAAQAHVLGPAFIQAARLSLRCVGRIELNKGDADAPGHADISLLTHVAGVAVWEAWMPGPRQEFDAARWTRWLDPEQPGSPAAQVWAQILPLSRAISGRADYGAYLPLSVIRLPEVELDDWLGEHTEQVVNLLWRDRIARALKPEVVDSELARDTCARVGGITLLGRRSALDLHGSRDDSAAEAQELALPPRSVFPFLITLELLSVERAVLQRLYDRLAHAGPRSIDDLLALKKEVMDGLEEYYGSTLASTRFNDVVAEQGEAMLGIVDLFDAVTDRLDMVSFTLTTNYQQRMTALQFWLTVVFGATEIGFIATSIATWFYRSGLGVVLTWTLGASIVSGAVLVALLRSKIK
ncbi:hypothetical protein [Thiomonas sp. FB-Cd]|uniref:hypothetical protein n=1 Tax=Thiomonas sp. FB-Cd TaxID=1158292 RepID=UPI0004DF0146|nr:hypothetical protein [Thiomonas sp. FB-Cd]